MNTIPNSIAATLRERGFDVVAVVSMAELRGKSDVEVFNYAAANNRRVVTENIKDFRPLLYSNPDAAQANLLLVPPRRFPRGGGNQAAAIANALEKWLSSANRPKKIG